MNKRILITGIPGTGKTTIGNFLEEKYGFIHTDMEIDNRRSLIHENPQEFIDSIIKDKDVIVTRGFHPNSIDVVNFFEKNSFEIFWFDGNREAAFREFEKRDMKISKDYGERQKIAFNQQIERINSSSVVDYINNVKIINTFNSDSEFLSTEEIVEKVLNG